MLATTFATIALSEPGQLNQQTDNAVHDGWKQDTNPSNYQIPLEVSSCLPHSATHCNFFHMIEQTNLASDLPKPFIFAISGQHVSNAVAEYLPESVDIGMLKC